MTNTLSTPPAGQQDLREALAELVALKDLKERLKRERSELLLSESPLCNDRVDWIEHNTRLADYYLRKPIAWANARAALTREAPAEPLTGPDGYGQVRLLRELIQRHCDGFPATDAETRLILADFDRAHDRASAQVGRALRDIETACTYSPHREAGTWDASLAKLIQHHARLLADDVSAAKVEAPAALPADLMQVVEQILDAGHMNTEDLGRLRAAWEASAPAPQAVPPADSLGPAGAERVANELREMVCGRAEWQVVTPDESGIVMWFSRDESASPQRDAEEWLSEHQRKYPKRFAGYKVKYTVVYSELERKVTELLDALARGMEARSAETEPSPANLDAGG